MALSLRVVLIAVVVLILAVFLGIAVFLGVKLIRLRRIISSDLMPTSGKIAFWASLVYAIFPIDLLPDPIYLDDIGVLAAALTYIHHLARKHGILGGQAGTDQPAALPRPAPAERRPPSR